MSFKPGPSRSSTTTSSISLGSRTPSGPMAAASMVMNKQANYQDSLFYIATKTLKRLEKVPDMGPYLELAYAKAEENAEQQAIAVSARNNTNLDDATTGVPNNSSESSGRSSDPLLGHWHSTLFTFAAGILPNQVMYDPVTPLWKLFQQGTPLCLIFNCLSPENAIDLVSSDDMKICKMSVYRFLIACKDVLNIRDDELFKITSVFSDDTSSLLNVIRSVNLVLDLDPAFDAPKVEDNNLFNSSDNRSRIVKEFVETERKFVQDLETLYKFKEDLISAELISSESINMLFPNLNEILDFQRRFLVGLECNASVPSKYQRIGSIFLHAGKQGFKIYEAWSLFQNSAVEFVNKEAESLIKSSTIMSSAYELQAFLIKPIQRLCKYPLLLKDLLKNTEQLSPNYNELQAAFLLSKEVGNDINEAQRKSENNQIMKELQDRVVDWKGYTLFNVGDLLFSNIVIVKDILADGHSVEKEVHCYLFERVIYFFKEVKEKKQLLQSRKKSTTSLSSYSSPTIQLSLNGIVFLNKIYRVSTTELSPYFANTPGHYLLLRWKGSKDTGGCVLKFRGQEGMIQWETTIKRLIQESEEYAQAQAQQKQQQQKSAHNSQSVISPPQLISHQTYNDETSMKFAAQEERERAARSHSASSSSESMQYLPKLRTPMSGGSGSGGMGVTNSINVYPPLPMGDFKLRSVSTPASTFDINLSSNRSNSQISSMSSIPNFHGLMPSNGEMALASTMSSLSMMNLNNNSAQTAFPPNGNPNRSKINMKLIHPELTIHLSVDAYIPFNSLITLLVNKLNYTLGVANDNKYLFTHENLKLKFRDEDGDFIRFQSEDDWQIAKEMLEEMEDEEERILNIKVV